MATRGERWLGFGLGLGAIGLAAWLGFFDQGGAGARGQWPEEPLSSMVWAGGVPASFHEGTYRADLPRAEVRVRVLHGGRVEPGLAVVRLADQGVGCGTARRRRAAKGTPDAQGEVVFQGVVQGPYSLWVEAPGAESAFQAVDVRGPVALTVAMPAPDAIAR